MDWVAVSVKIKNNQLNVSNKMKIKGYNHILEVQILGYDCLYEQKTSFSKKIIHHDMPYEKVVQ